MRIISNLELNAVSGGARGSVSTSLCAGEGGFGGWDEDGWNCFESSGGGGGGGEYIQTVEIIGHRDTAYIDSILAGLVGQAARGAAVAFVDGIIVGAEIGSAGGPAGVLIGILVGGGAAYLGYKLLH